MHRRTGRRDKYPWPVHVSGLTGARDPLPQPGPALAVESAPGSVEPEGGELAASPWIGLHYASEGS